jgi:3-methyladenine DNA glycosylase/8-oxoguanine DNA glycosylase
MMDGRFTPKTFKRYCTILRKKFQVIDTIHQLHGFPPFWKRENSFLSLCKTIIEQQISLAAANSIYARFEECFGSIKPIQFQYITDEQFKQCGLTRQKSDYIRHVAKAFSEEPDLATLLESFSNEEVFKTLCSIKGIGKWTANVYMITALNRLDIYPHYDVALINSISKHAFENFQLTDEQACEYMEQFRPYRSIACCYFYHAYTATRSVRFIP